MGYSKVIYNNKVLIDLTGDTLLYEWSNELNKYVSSQLKEGATTHGSNGELVTGVSTDDSDTADATATSADILYGKTAYVRGVKVTGIMPNIGAQNGTISTKTGSVVIKQGYHDGSGRVTLDSDAVKGLLATNIREGITVLGITGTMSGTEGSKPTELTVIPKATSQNYQPTDLGDFNAFSQVTVTAVPYTETDNAAGGKTVKIL